MIALLYLAISISAVPFSKFNSLHLVKRGNQNLPFHYPPSNVVHPVYLHLPTSFVKVSDSQIALSALEAQYGIAKTDMRVISHFKDSYGVSHVYVDRMIVGVSVKNHNAAVHIKDGVILSITSSIPKLSKKDLIDCAQYSELEPVVLLEEAVKIAETKLGAPKDTVTASLAFIEIPGGSLVFAHQFQLRDDKTSKFYHVSVDSKNGQVVQVIDYYNRAAKFNAIKLPRQLPTDGFEFVSGEEDKNASPIGWNNDGTTSFTTTQGNNVDVRIGDYRPDGGIDLLFDSKWNSTESPDSDANKQVSATHLFYLLNKVHDIAYQYGFTEAAGNFQQSDFEKGGVAGDGVIANTESIDGTNNANFATPPDGQSGIMNMYLFDITSPNRDGSLDSTIPIHELTHGISNRLTGGARNGECLQTDQSAGMGEGWSDTMAIYLGRTSRDSRSTNVTLGTYVLGQDANGKGIRRYKYSTDMATNPLTYASYLISNEVHDLGEIWATTLYEVYWNLVDKLGFTENWMDATSSKGNIVAMQIVIGGMMLQPCNPTMLQARDAIILADKNYYGGSNFCDIWKAFAKRGFGIDVNGETHVDGFKLPEIC